MPSFRKNRKNVGKAKSWHTSAAPCPTSPSSRPAFQSAQVIECNNSFQTLAIENGQPSAPTEFTVKTSVTKVDNWLPDAPEASVSGGSTIQGQENLNGPVPANGSEGYPLKELPLLGTSNLSPPAQVAVKNPGSANPTDSVSRSRSSGAAQGRRGAIGPRPNTVHGDILPSYAESSLTPPATASGMTVMQTQRNGMDLPPLYPQAPEFPFLSSVCTSTSKVQAQGVVTASTTSAAEVLKTALGQAAGPSTVEGNSAGLQGNAFSTSPKAPSPITDFHSPLGPILDTMNPVIDITAKKSKANNLVVQNGAAQPNTPHDEATQDTTSRNTTSRDTETEVITSITTADLTIARDVFTREIQIRNKPAQNAEEGRANNPQPPNGLVLPTEDHPAVDRNTHNGTPVSVPMNNFPHGEHGTPSTLSVNDSPDGDLADPGAVASASSQENPHRSGNIGIHSFQNYNPGQDLTGKS